MPALTRASQHRQCEGAAHSQVSRRAYSLTWFVSKLIIFFSNAQAMPAFTTSNKSSKGATMIVRGNQVSSRAPVEHFSLRASPHHLHICAPSRL